MNNTKFLDDLPWDSFVGEHLGIDHATEEVLSSPKSGLINETHSHSALI
jgi:hypothetical protein